MLTRKWRERLEQELRVNLSFIRIETNLSLRRRRLAGLACGSTIQLDPDCSEDDRVLAHELAHVLQWMSGRVPQFSGMLWSRTIEAEAASAAAWILRVVKEFGSTPIPGWLARAKLHANRNAMAPELPLYEWTWDGKQGHYRRVQKTSLSSSLRFYEPGLKDYVHVPAVHETHYLKQAPGAIPYVQGTLPPALGYNEIADRVFSDFTQEQLMKLREVSTFFWDVAERIIWLKVSFMGFSSLLPSQGMSLKAVIRKKLQDVHDSGGVARMASDQITSGWLIEELIGPLINIRINIGTTNLLKSKEQERWKARQVKPPELTGKAHAKFISGGGGVLVTSANFTPAAMNDNVESGMVTNSLQMQGFFNRYWELMRNSNQRDKEQFKRLLEAFNHRTQKVKLALAPFVEIQPWLECELQGASTIIIRMFLISHFNYGDDIVQGLNKLARAGAEIQVYVDGSQFLEAHDASGYYVQQACRKLMEGTTTVQVFTQHRFVEQAGSHGHKRGQGEDVPKCVQSIMHDKLILATWSDGKNVKVKTLLGSSGFTQSVMGNRSYELMVSVQEDGLYNYLLEHHFQSLQHGHGIETFKWDDRDISEFEENRAPTSSQSRKKPKIEKKF
jgi:hypothetical protein